MLGEMDMKSAETMLLTDIGFAERIMLKIFAMEKKGCGLAKLGKNCSTTEIIQKSGLIGDL